MRRRGWDIRPTEPAGRADPREMTVSPVPNSAGRILRHDPGCFPSASPTPTPRPGKQKTAPKDRFNTLISLRKSGAGEGIRTLDPNLGKVGLRTRSERSLQPVTAREWSQPLGPIAVCPVVTMHRRKYSLAPRLTLLDQTLTHASRANRPTHPRLNCRLRARTRRLSSACLHADDVINIVVQRIDFIGVP
jgi:hypothetical protein